MLSDKFIQDVLQWDTINWAAALKFWNEDLVGKKGKALELGSNQGGLSLWLEKSGFDVICSDLESPEKSASNLHTRYQTSRIKYEAVDALDIQYENHFDVICFKSILGGIARNGNDENRHKCVVNIHKALKPGGTLYFAENLKASRLHMFFRRKFIKNNSWNYLNFDEVESLFSNFSDVKFYTVGFFGAFGRSESQRRFLGKVDRLMKFIIPKSKRYIVYGYARK